MEQSSVARQLIDFVRSRIALSLLLAAHLPFLFAYYTSLWKQQSHYQFFPFALAAFAVLFWQRRSTDGEKWTRLPLALIVLDINCMIVGAAIESPWMFAFGMSCSIVALCLATTDQGFNRRLTYLSLLPLLTIRLPVNGDMQVIHGLQGITTTIASKSLQRFGILHVRSGNVLDFPGKRFLVEEACSGVQSVFTILFIAALIICVKRRTLAHGVVLLGSGIIFAGLMNVTRVITIAVAWDRHNTDLSTGWQHDAIGYGCLAVAALLLWSADSFLAFITDTVPDVRRPGPVGAFRNPLIAAWNYFFTVAETPATSAGRAAVAAATKDGRSVTMIYTVLSGALCATLLVAQASSFFGRSSGAPAPAAAGLTSFPETLLPATLEGFVIDQYAAEIRDATDVPGAFSSVWNATRDGLTARVSCDYPYSGWHNQHEAYAERDWHVLSVEVRPGAEQWDAVIARMAHPSGGRHAIVIYSIFNQSHQAVQPHGIGSTGELVLQRVFGSGDAARQNAVTYVCQIYAETTLPADEQQLKELMALHFASRDLLRKAN